MIIFAVWIVGWIVFGTLWANYFLNSRYQGELRYLVSEREYLRNGSDRYETYAEYLLTQKETAYREALDDSRVDRNCSFVLCGMLWPLSIWVLLYFHFNKSSWRHKIGPLGLSKASRDLKDSIKNVTKAAERAAIEEAKVSEWNKMIADAQKLGLDTTGLEKL